MYRSCVRLKTSVAAAQANTPCATLNSDLIGDLRRCDAASTSAINTHKTNRQSGSRTIPAKYGIEEMLPVVVCPMACANTCATSAREAMHRAAASHPVGAAGCDTAATSPSTAIAARTIDQTYVRTFVGISGKREPRPQVFLRRLVPLEHLEHRHHLNNELGQQHFASPPQGFSHTWIADQSMLQGWLRSATYNFGLPAQLRYWSRGRGFFTPIKGGREILPRCRTAAP